MVSSFWKVPTTFNEMFLFNAAVMGLGENSWMAVTRWLWHDFSSSEVILEQFHNIVVNVANSYRLLLAL